MKHTKNTMEAISTYLETQIYPEQGRRKLGKLRGADSTRRHHGWRRAGKF